MLLTEQHIEQYKRLENPPQALYNALVRQVQVNSMHKRKGIYSTRRRIYGISYLLLLFKAARL